ncbi:MAG: glycosyltransferase family 2 protein [Clostridia bacterium]|nr:glycosyltransferase family 2 protein [Clostridia bacterium]
MKLSLVVPCYNEEDVIYDFYKEVRKVFENKVESYELVFVNDGSKDKTIDILKAIHQVSDNVKVVNFSRNFGKEAAMYAGLQQTSGEYTCVIDADLQQRPEVVLEMMDILDNDENIDCVAAYQEERKESKALTFFKDSFYKLMNKICEIEFYPGASDFRLMRRTMVDAVLGMTEYHRFSKGLFSFVGFNTKFIPYEVQERAAGESKWSFSKLFIYAVEGIVGYTTAPLKVASFAGIGFMLLAFLYMIVALIVGAATASITSAIAIITLILFTCGVQLLFIGIIGEYLARTYMQGKNRPVFIAKEILTYEEKEDE